MKIEKLSIDDNTGAIERKINELIETVNKLTEKHEKKPPKEKKE